MIHISPKSLNNSTFSQWHGLDCFRPWKLGNTSKRNKNKSRFKYKPKKLPILACTIHMTRDRSPMWIGHSILVHAYIHVNINHQLQIKKSWCSTFWQHLNLLIHVICYLWVLLEGSSSDGHIVYYYIINTLMTMSSISGHQVICHHCIDRMCLICYVVQYILLMQQWHFTWYSKCDTETWSP